MPTKHFPLASRLALVGIFAIVTLIAKANAQEGDPTSDTNSTDVIGPDPLPPTATGPASGDGPSDSAPSQYASPGFSSPPTNAMDPANLAASPEADTLETSMPELSMEPTKEAQASPMMYESSLPQPSVDMSPGAWPTWTVEMMPSVEVYGPTEESMIPWGGPTMWPSGEMLPDYEPSVSLMATPEEELYPTPMQSSWTSPEPSISSTALPSISTSVSVTASTSMTSSMSATSSVSSTPSVSLTPSVSSTPTPSMSMMATVTPSTSSTPIASTTTSTEPSSTPDVEPPKCQRRFTSERDMRCVASSKTIRRDDLIRFRVQTQQEYRSIQTTLMVWGGREIRKYAIEVDMGGNWGKEKKTLEDFGDSVVTVDRRNSSGKPIKVTMISHTADVDDALVPEGMSTCCGMRYRIMAYMLICKGRTMEGCRDVIMTRIRRIKCWDACFKNPDGTVTKMSKKVRCSRCDDES